MKHHLTKEESNHWVKLVDAMPDEAIKEIISKEWEGCEFSDVTEMREHIKDYWPEDYAYTIPLYGMMKRVAKKYKCYVELVKLPPFSDNVRSEDIIKTIIGKIEADPQKSIAKGLDIKVTTNPAKWKRFEKFKDEDKGVWYRAYHCKKCGTTGWLKAECEDDGEKITDCKIYFVPLMDVESRVVMRVNGVEQ